jgi:hypothetical protein
VPRKKGAQYAVPTMKIVEEPDDFEWDPPRGVGPYEAALLKLRDEGGMLEITSYGPSALKQLWRNATKKLRVKLLKRELGDKLYVKIVEPEKRKRGRPRVAPKAS